MVGSMSTRSRSRASTRPRPHMTQEEEIIAIARESAREVLRERRRLEQRAANSAAGNNAVAEEEVGSQPAGDERLDHAAEQGAGSTEAAEEVLEQSFDFEDLSDSGLDSDMSLDPDPYADTTLTRLLKASAELDPDRSIVFPSNRVLPKAAVFLRCHESHVFALPQQIDSLSASEDSHAIARVTAPCPQCVSDKVTSDIFCSRKCAFCMTLMPRLINGRYVCLTQTCWFARCHFQNGSDKAIEVWKEVWRQMDNRYFFIGPWDEFLSYSNDPDRNGQDKAAAAAYPYTV